MTTLNPNLILHQYGSTAVLVECTDLSTVMRVTQYLRQLQQEKVFEPSSVIPAARTVLIQVPWQTSPEALLKQVEQHLEAFAGTIQEAVHTGGQLQTAPGEWVRIPVHYDGEDLPHVAELLGLTVTELINRHCTTDYDVAFTGFAPGFSYLTSAQQQLTVPRRDTPRTRIPAGSVALAGEFCGIYPRQSPGGWQLIGHTPLKLWDLSQDMPALLRPGMRVRFEAQREQLTVIGREEEIKPRQVSGTRAASAADTSDANTESAVPAAILVREAGLLTTVQDGGRPGFAELGVGRAGAADSHAFTQANMQLGNDPGVPMLELSVGRVALQAQRTLVGVLTGASRPSYVEGPWGWRTIAMEQPFRLDPAEVLTLEEPTSGLRTMLAFRGGLLVQRTLGSASRDTLAQLGPEPLQPGDELWVGPQPERVVQPGANHKRPLPRRGEVLQLRVDAGPRADWFAAGMHGLTDTIWRVSEASDRVGIRLAGSTLERADDFKGRELTSEGIVSGSVQVPASGQPVLFLADHPVTGGYPVVAVVIPADLPLAAQLPPGAQVQFVTVQRDETPETPEQIR